MFHAKERHSVLPKKLTNKSEGRRFRRIAIDAPVRAVINGIDEVEGRLLNMSPGDLALKAAARAVVGDAVVVYVAGIDVIEGTVARLFPDGFAVSFRLSKSRQATLTEQLMLRAHPEMKSLAEDRRITPRHKLGDQRMVCRLHDGASLYVRVLDMSVDGVAVEAPRKPPVGTPIHVGRMRGVVTRHTPRGFVVVYDNRPKDENAQPKLRVV